MTHDSSSEDVQKFGFVTILGKPNAGKSTLINQLVGSKISIVSPKVQTTRARVMGIMSHAQTQIVFVDTPGVFAPDQKNPLERAIVQSAIDALAQTDMVLLLVDVSQKNPLGQDLLLSALKESAQKNVVLVLNKIDMIKRDRLLELSAALNALYDFRATFMISALKGSGTQDLIRFVAAYMPQENWHFPEDEMTDMPMRLMAAEITREKLFYALHQELPYHLTVETEQWEEFENGDLKLEQVIYVTRDAHKKIILGKGGAMIKTIGMKARSELQNILDCPVHLKLFVKVHDQWMHDAERYTPWGLSLPSGAKK